ncbi:MAG: RNA methyltransferase [uncultured bacterium]|nr:MAG: RNA methyltransferase [uncultured bacterium]
MGCAQQKGHQFRVPFVLPGEKVLATVVGTKKGLFLCRLQEVLESSPKRRRPPCPYFGTCGGCNLQHMVYAEQLRLKQEWLTQLFERHTGRGEFVLHPIIPSVCEDHYRSRITLHHDRRIWGYHQHETNDIIPVTHCFIANLAVNEQLKTLPDTVLSGANDFEIREDDEAGFVQVNRVQNDVLRDCVMKAGRGRKWKTVLDLYCGAGNFAFPLSQIAGRVLAVDADPRAIEVGERERLAQKNKKISFVLGDAVTVVSDLAHDYQAFDLIVCDPPRGGLGSVVNYLPRLQPQRIIYVSCQAQNFINEAQVLSDKGYQLVQVTPIDMFPQTHHIELVGVFDRG